jgi:hypothetical protein
MTSSGYTLSTSSAMTQSVFVPANLGNPIVATDAASQRQAALSLHRGVETGPNAQALLLAHENGHVLGLTHRSPASPYGLMKPASLAGRHPY